MKNLVVVRQNGILYRSLKTHMSHTDMVHMCFSRVQFSKRILEHYLNPDKYQEFFANLIFLNIARRGERTEHSIRVRTKRDERHIVKNVFWIREGKGRHDLYARQSGQVGIWVKNQQFFNEFFRLLQIGRADARVFLNGVPEISYHIDGYVDKTYTKDVFRTMSLLVKEWNQHIVFPTYYALFLQHILTNSVKNDDLSRRFIRRHLFQILTNGVNNIQKVYWTNHIYLSKNTVNVLGRHLSFVFVKRKRYEKRLMDIDTDIVLNMCNLEKYRITGKHQFVSFIGSSSEYPNMHIQNCYCFHKQLFYQVVDWNIPISYLTTRNEQILKRLFFLSKTKKHSWENLLRITEMDRQNLENRLRIVKTDWQNSKKRLQIGETDWQYLKSQLRIVEADRQNSEKESEISILNQYTSQDIVNVTERYLSFATTKRKRYEKQLMDIDTDIMLNMRGLKNNRITGKCRFVPIIGSLSEHLHARIQERHYYNKRLRNRTEHESALTDYLITKNKQISEKLLFLGKTKKRSQENLLRITETDCRNSKKQLRIVKTDWQNSKKRLQIGETDWQYLKSQLWIVEADRQNSKKRLQIGETDWQYLKSQLWIVEADWQNSKKRLQIGETDWQYLKRQLRIVEADCQNSKKRLQIVETDWQYLKSQLWIVETDWKNLEKESGISILNQYTSQDIVNVTERYLSFVLAKWKHYEKQLTDADTDIMLNMHSLENYRITGIRRFVAIIDSLPEHLHARIQERYYYNKRLRNRTEHESALTDYLTTKNKQISEKLLFFGKTKKRSQENLLRITETDCQNSKKQFQVVKTDCQNSKKRLQIGETDRQYLKSQLRIVEADRQNLEKESGISILNRYALQDIVNVTERYLSFVLAKWKHYEKQLTDADTDIMLNMHSLENYRITGIRRFVAIIDSLPEHLHARIQERHYYNKRLRNHTEHESALTDYLTTRNKHLLKRLFFLWETKKCSQENLLRITETDCRNSEKRLRISETNQHNWVKELQIAALKQCNQYAAEQYLSFTLIKRKSLEKRGQIVETTKSISKKQLQISKTERCILKNQMTDKVRYKQYLKKQKQILHFFTMIWNLYNDQRQTYATAQNGVRKTLKQVSLDADNSLIDKKFLIREFFQTLQKPFAASKQYLLNTVILPETFVLKASVLKTSAVNESKRQFRFNRCRIFLQTLPIKKKIPHSGFIIDGLTQNNPINENLAPKYVSEYEKSAEREHILYYVSQTKILQKQTEDRLRSESYERIKDAEMLLQTNLEEEIRKSVQQEFRSLEKKIQLEEKSIEEIRTLKAELKKQAEQKRDRKRIQKLEEFFNNDMELERKRYGIQ